MAIRRFLAGEGADIVTVDCDASEEVMSNVTQNCSSIYMYP